MAKTGIVQRTINPVALDDYLATWIEAFLIDRKAQNMAGGTLRFYRAKLALFSRYCEGQVITRISEITADTIRRWMLYLEDNGHNPGGIHAAYRAVRAFLLWFEAETEPGGWKNPEAPARGVELTPAGRAVFKRIANHPTPTPPGSV